MGWYCKAFGVRPPHGWWEHGGRDLPWRHVQWCFHYGGSQCPQKPHPSEPVGGPGLLRLHGTHAVHVADNLRKRGHAENPRRQAEDFDSWNTSQVTSDTTDG